ncbi:MAG: flagellar assembly peptidoglycan hydrolase FlgJ [Cellvibrionaceae bacterium]
MNPSLPPIDLTQKSVLDLTSLQSVKGMGKTDKAAALQQMAKQFESLFVQQMLKSMRSANEVFGEGSYFDSSEIKFHRDMMDTQMSQHLVSGRGLGLADAFYTHMSKQYLTDEEIEKGAEINGDLPGRERFAPVSSVEKREKVEPMAGPEDFVDKLMDMAKGAAEKLGVDVKAILAQAALETGWGKYITQDQQGGSSFNLFNIKADARWDGDKVKVSTLEYDGNVAKRENAFFRAYQSFSESFDDYVDFLQDNPRYKKALDAVSDPVAFVKELQAAGYATDPQYANKIKQVLDNPAFKKLL